jgi:DNA-binding SARP family transcriptional activator/tetratricopeptide (TPR) repeat protein
MERLALTLLGGFQARQGSGRALTLSGKKARALLAYLGVHPGMIQQRETLTALLWGEVPGDQARHSLRQTLVDLRRVLPNGKVPVLLTEGDGLALNPARVEVDVGTFELLAKQGKPAALERAAALYTGDLLAGFALREPAFEEWLRTERDRLREAALRTLRRLLAAQTSGAELERAVQTGVKLLAIDPLQEPVHRAVMELYEKLGRRSAALRQYHLCAEMLQRELGIPPDAETRSLFERLSPKPAPDASTKPQRTRPRRVKEPQATPGNGTDIPVVGRQAELTRLLAAAREAAHGRGQLIILRGDAGIGKTRLLQELESHAGSLGLTPLLGGCFDVTRALAFSPWVEALRAAGVTEDRELADQLATTWRAEIGRLIPELGLPGVQASEQPQDHLRLFEAVTQLLDQLAGRQPLLVMLEDIHWADDMSVRLLFHLARRLRKAPVLLAATVRTDQFPQGGAVEQLLRDLERDRPDACVDLRPLSRIDAAILVRTAAKAERSTLGIERLSEQVWEISQGNPFVIIETLRALPEVELGSDVRVSLPGRIRDLIAGRLQRLGEPARRLVATAAVAGRDVDFAVLHRASGLSERDAADALEQLLRRKVLRETDSRFDFLHDRIREVALGELIPQQRRVIHRAIAEALEELHQRDVDANLSALGTHYLLGEVWDKAAHYLRRAGAQAYTRWANREAVQYLEQAIAALAKVPRSPATVIESVDLHLDLRRALIWLAESRRAIDGLIDVEPLAEDLGDVQRLGYINTYLAADLTSLREYEQAKTRAERALIYAAEAGDITLEIEAPHHAGQLYYCLGDYLRAREFFGRSLALLEDDVAREHRGLAARFGEHRRFLVGHFGVTVVLSTVRLNFGLTLQFLGEFSEAIRCAEAALRDSASEQSAGGLTTTFANFLRGVVHVQMGEFTQAVPVLERAVAACRALEPLHTTYLAPTTSYLAYVYARCGRFKDGEVLLDEILERSASVQARERHRIAMLSEACLWLGRGSEAKQIAAAELAYARRHCQRGYEALTLRTLGEIALRGEPVDLDQAVLCFRESLILAEELAMRPLQARLHLFLSQALARTKGADAALPHRKAAIALLTELGMENVLVQADAEPGHTADRN